MDGLCLTVSETGSLPRQPWGSFRSSSYSGFLLSAFCAVLGKAEGAGEDWHGHVSAVTVAPEYRRLGLARRLMQELERVSEDIYRGYFVDLFVRQSNVTAITMYQKLGYAVFRKVLGYYGRTSASVDDSENAFDMRRACKRNATRKIDAMIPLPRPIKPENMWPTDGSKPLA
jgi:N-terminal acetyltransferase B complex catalytic subunit